MSNPNRPAPVVFGQSVDEEKRAKYQQLISQAKGHDPVGGGKLDKPIPILKKSGATEEKGGLKQETQEGLTELADELKKGMDKDGKSTKEATKKEEEEKDDLWQQLFTMYGRTESERVTNNPDRRKEVESRLVDMDLSDLIEKDEVRQEVQIVKDKFWCQFRSLRERDYLFLNSFVSKMVSKKLEDGEVKKPEEIVGWVNGLCVLVASVVSLNGKQYLSIYDQSGGIDEDLFRSKFSQLLSMSAYVIADLQLNLQWFDVRVKKLLSPGDLGNG